MSTFSAANFTALSPSSVFSIATTTERVERFASSSSSEPLPALAERPESLAELM